MPHALISKWGAMLQPIVAAARDQSDSHAALAARLAGDGNLRQPMIHDRRQELASFLAYAARLAGADIADIGDDSVFGQLANWLRARADRPSFAVASLGQEFVVCPRELAPELYWYHQLTTLHALTSYACLSNDPGACGATARLARFIQADIQPDHATALPWALHAFILTDGCEPTAEWILNACMIQSGGEPAGSALVILAEVLYCLRHVRDAKPKSI